MFKKIREFFKLKCPNCGGEMYSIFLDMEIDKFVYECKKMRKEVDLMENKEVKEALYELSIQTDKEIVYQDEINGYVNTIQNYIERLEQALINKIEWKSAKQVLPQEWNGNTRTMSDDVLGIEV